jgi:hypothetical protein
MPTIDRKPTKQYLDIPNVRNQAEEDRLGLHDNDSDFALNEQEARDYYADKMGSPVPAGANPIQAAYEAAGGAQRVLKQYFPDYSNTSGWERKGDFQLKVAHEHKGAGKVFAGPIEVYDRDTQRLEKAFDVMFNCDFIDRGFIDGHVKEAFLVVAKKGFKPEGRSNYGEQHAIPMRILTYDDGSFGHPGKVMGATVGVEPLRQLSGGEGLSFYGRLKVTRDDGTQTTAWINLGGQEMKTFEIADAELYK